MEKKQFHINEKKYHLRLIKSIFLTIKNAQTTVFTVFERLIKNIFIFFLNFFCKENNFHAYFSYVHLTTLTWTVKYYLLHPQLQ